MWLLKSLLKYHPNENLSYFDLSFGYMTQVKEHFSLFKIYWIYKTSVQLCPIFCQHRTPTLAVEKWTIIQNRLAWISSLFILHERSKLVVEPSLAASSFSVTSSVRTILLHTSDVTIKDFDASSSISINFVGESKPSSGDLSRPSSAQISNPSSCKITTIYY